MAGGALSADAFANRSRDPELRVAQEAADAYERSRIGGLFIVAVWVLMCMTAGQNGAREWLIGSGFLALAFARLAVGALRRKRPQAHAQHLAATLAVMIVSMAAWGAATAFALIHPDFANTPTVILFATSAFTTAYVHSYPMRLRPAYAGLLAGYGPPFVALLIADRAGAAPIAIGVSIHFAYLILAARRAHFEYHRSIDLEQELRAQRDLFSRRSRIDALTSLGNRGEFNDRLAQSIEDARAGQSLLTLLIIDIGHFKAVNDEHGHAVGDECLIALADRLRQTFVLPGEFIARLGGEEFAVLMDRCVLADASARAEAFRAELAARALAIKGCDMPITVSIGVGEFHPKQHADADTLYRAVDGALYRAKRDGRNRIGQVHAIDPPNPPVPTTTWGNRLAQ